MYLNHVFQFHFFFFFFFFFLYQHWFLWSSSNYIKKNKRIQLDRSTIKVENNFDVLYVWFIQYESIVHCVFESYFSVFDQWQHCYSLVLRISNFVSSPYRLTGNSLLILTFDCKMLSSPSLCPLAFTFDLRGFYVCGLFSTASFFYYFWCRSLCILQQPQSVF